MVGKWIPLQNIKNKKDINFCLYKNKELVQQGNSSLMIHNFDKVVAYISNYFSVNIGDLIFTGTPDGVGECVVGDELEAFIEDDSMLTLEIK
jgi:2-keto-4-pentenoate hydratase/2-oxohepta-3-ene-1,7-dioic acid hydratase in catechol pathway